MSEGVIATSYAAGDKFFIDPAKLLPLERFLPQPKGAAPRGGGRGASPVLLHRPWPGPWSGPGPSRKTRPESEDGLDISSQALPHACVWLPHLELLIAPSTMVDSRSRRDQEVMLVRLPLRLYAHSLQACSQGMLRWTTVRCARSVRHCASFGRPIIRMSLGSCRSVAPVVVHLNGLH